MAAAQRPAGLAAPQGRSTEPAWKTLPPGISSPPTRPSARAAQRFMAKRAKAHTVEINASHVVMISHPDEVTDLILQAARSVR